MPNSLIGIQHEFQPMPAEEEARRILSPKAVKDAFNNARNPTKMDRLDILFIMEMDGEFEEAVVATVDINFSPNNARDITKRDPQRAAIGEGWSLSNSAIIIEMASPAFEKAILYGDIGVQHLARPASSMPGPGAKLVQNGTHVGIGRKPGDGCAWIYRPAPVRIMLEYFFTSMPITRIMRL
ncbi:hypothetical protein CC78DRAFT_541888 [Lojkania enalia]|uniref:Uncharacterized protein n=1 Tax=Lojkania enalia TaxID=147567 RepID=A0A9P4KFJ3_9PLEO|nr:hypothetical protein CC78DRAFT_541888 [Didymosphaeria enalia]